jgi:ABC-type glutathione transport system ATPase component
MLEAKGLSKRYGEVDAVQALSARFEEEQTYALVGESGSGKSTLARILTGLEKPSSGDVLWNGENIRLMTSRQLRKKRADYQLVLQNAAAALAPRMTIYQSIAEPLRYFKRMNPVDERQRILQLLEQVRLPPQLLERLPHTLSGGQLKRVSIARAMAVEPRFIIFDEATSGLDVTVKKEILDLIVRLKAETLRSFLFITHDVSAALYVAGDVLVMKEGIIVERVKNTNGDVLFKHPYSMLLTRSIQGGKPLEIYNDKEKLSCLRNATN